MSYSDKNGNNGCGRIERLTYLVNIPFRHGSPIELCQRAGQASLGILFLLKRVFTIKSALLADKRGVGFSR